MALSANTVWEVQHNGDDTFGGGFVTGAAGTDYSLQTTAQVVINNSTITCTTPSANSNTLTFTAGYTPSSADVGNIVQISAGTNINAGFYQITGQSSTTWTLAGAANLTTAGGAGSAITGKMGGALASIGKIGSVLVSGHIVFIKYSATPYSITSASNNVAGGCFNASSQIIVVGYDTTRSVANTDANRPTLQASGISSANVITLNSFSVYFNLIIDGNNLSAIGGFITAGTGQELFNCHALNCTNAGFSSANGWTTYYKCSATGCSTVAAFLLTTSGALALNCVAYSNSSNIGFSLQSGAMAVGCISYNNGTGFKNTGRGAVFQGCIAYGNSSHGFDNNTQNVVLYSGCVAEANGGWGWTGAPGSQMNAFLQNCAAYNNTSGAFNGFTSPYNTTITNTTGTFFTNAAGQDFSLNNLANQGALLRAAFTTRNVWPVISTIGYSDIGAAQHQDVGGMVVHPGMSGGMRG